MKIKTKHSIGDVVYRSGTRNTQKQHPCPDCMGSKQWVAISPAGSEYTFACPRCQGGYISNQVASLRYLEHIADVSELTIGSVRTDSNTGITYMCEETGVGSGTVYDEESLFSKNREAQIDAEHKATELNIETRAYSDKYSESLRLSDYELKSVPKGES